MMKKIILLYIILTSFISVITAQELPPDIPPFDSLPTVPYEPPEPVIQNPPESEISVNYGLSALKFSNKFHGLDSIFTWRDIFLHGAEANYKLPFAPFGFDITNIGIGFSASFNGYFTGDDANNAENMIAVTSVDTLLLSLSYELKNITNTYNFFAGLDLNCLWFKNNDMIYYTADGLLKAVYLNKDSETRYGLYRLGIYGGLDYYLLDVRPNVYIRTSILSGAGVYLGFPNWVHHDLFGSPVLIYDLGISFRTGGEAEMLIRIGRFSWFINFNFLYEMSPAGLSAILASGSNSYYQLVTASYSEINFCTGIKIAF